MICFQHIFAYSCLFPEVIYMQHNKVKTRLFIVRLIISILLMYSSLVDQGKMKPCNVANTDVAASSKTTMKSMRDILITRTKLAALYSATKSLQNSCTAKLQLFSSLLEAKQQLHSSCSGMQKRCAAFEGSLKLFSF